MSIDIKVSQISKQKFHELEPSQLVLNISGKNVSPSLVNTLRRLALLYVPTWACYDQSIEIEKNNSVFNNDYMRSRLAQFTWPNLNHDIDFLEDKYWEKIDYSNLYREKHPKDNIQLEVYCNAKNTTPTISNVTTKDLQYFKNGEQVKIMDDEFPHLVIKLKPNQEFVFKGNYVLGIGIRNDIFGAASNCYYHAVKEEDPYPSEYVFTMESCGQLDEYDILIKSCKILRKKLEIIKQNINNEHGKKEEKELIIKLENEDHTMGNIINVFFQDHPKISLSGCARPDLLVREMVIKCQSIDNKIVSHIFEAIESIDKTFIHLEKVFVDLHKKASSK